MKNVIVYFHGFGSNPGSNKVERLKGFGDVYAFDIDLDPRISIKSLYKFISLSLLNYINEEINLVFVGTSLGAWYAAKMYELFDVENCILINPAYDPMNTLNKYGVDDEIRNSYEKLAFEPGQFVFIGKQDDVLNYSDVDFNGATVEYVEARR